MKILLVGASSDISKSLQNNFSSNYEFISLSSNSDFSSIDNFNILDPATYLEIDSIDGIDVTSPLRRYNPQVTANKTPGRNERVMLQGPNGEMQFVKYKNAQPLLNQGYQLV